MTVRSTRPWAVVELVFHTASPFVFSRASRIPQKDLVDPAVRARATRSSSANRMDSVKRVVLTSSVVSIYGDAVDLKDAQGDVFTEDDWNTTSSLTHQPYSYSKVEAENVAWEIAGAQDRWDLVVINPGFVLGPSLTTASNSASFKTMRQFVDGTMRMGAPPLEFGVVDVRDVAKTYTGVGGSGNKTITLTVTSGTTTETSTVAVQVFDPTLMTLDGARSLRINMAIEDGLRYLWTVSANRTTFDANNFTSWGRASFTALVVLAFENHGYQLPNNNTTPTGIYEKYPSGGA